MDEEELIRMETMAQCWPRGSAPDVLLLVAEVRRLRELIGGLANRVAAQSELLSRQAEKTQ